jgi:hypothetical protein
MARYQHLPIYKKAMDIRPLICHSRLTGLRLVENLSLKKDCGQATMTENLLNNYETKAVNLRTPHKGGDFSV